MKTIRKGLSRLLYLASNGETKNTFPYAPALCMLITSPGVFLIHFDIPCRSRIEENGPEQILKYSMVPPLDLSEGSSQSQREFCLSVYLSTNVFVRGPLSQWRNHQLQPNWDHLK